MVAAGLRRSYVISPFTSFKQSIHGLYGLLSADIGVDRGGGYGRVPELLLDKSQVLGLAVKDSPVTVSAGVYGIVRRQPCLLQSHLEGILKGSDGVGLPVAGYQYERLRGQGFLQQAFPEQVIRDMPHQVL